MNSKSYDISKIVEELCAPESYLEVAHRSDHYMPMPSVDALRDVVETLRSVLFPGYAGNSEIKPEAMTYYVGAALDKVYHTLSEQILRGFCFDCEKEKTIHNKEACQKRAYETTEEFIKRIPSIRKMLATDVYAAYIGDPAAKSPGETIFCYPSIRALTNYRIAHELYLIDVPLIPRIITEMAHSETGIDIHPGATIREQFFMDHGTGIVIGETCIIGKNVRVYQGVTLGAKSFPLDDEGNPIKGIPRHPVVEDNVIIYSGATILGRVTIGHDSEIGGNVWITKDIPPNSKIVQKRATTEKFIFGEGI